MQKSILITLTFLILFLSLSSVSSATFNNTSTTKDIQDFINNGTSTDTELVLDGEFNNLSTLNVNRSIKISGKNNARITKNSSSSATVLFNITTVNVTIENLIIRGYDTAIQSNKGNLTIANNDINSAKTAINIENNTELKEINIINNKITAIGDYADGIYLYSSGDIIANNFYNNSISTNSGGTCGIFLTSDSGIVNNTFYNNSISTNGSDSYGVYFYSTNGFVENNSFYNNSISTNKDDTHGIYLASYPGLINNSFYNNSISTKGEYSYGLYLITYGGVVENNSFYNNFISTNKDYAYGILLEAKSIFGNNLFNNSITTNGTYAYGIYLYSYDIIGKGSIIGNSIVGNNIMANSTGINVDGNIISSLNVSYNRILAKDTFINLTKMDNSNRFFANWLGNNTPDMNKIININMTSFYIMNATAVKNAGLINDDWLINYTFYLNGTNETDEYLNLPYFMAQLMNDDTLVSNHAGSNSGNWNVPIKQVVTKAAFDVVLDNERITLGLFNSEKGTTQSTINLTGETGINKTVQIKSNLKNQNGTDLSGKLITLYVNGIAVETKTTDYNGNVVFDYTFNKASNYEFQIAFAGDNLYNSTKSNVKSIMVNKIPTKIDLTIRGDTKVGKTIKLIAKLSYNPNIAGEEIIFKLNGEVIGTGTTNTEGIATLDYVISSAGFYSFSAEYMGNRDFELANTILDITVDEEPTPTPSPKPTNETNKTESTTKTNKTNNNPTTQASTMKTTGIPINLILIVLLSSLGLIIHRKQN